MAVDYNSELIDRLYTETNPRKSTQIADEMAEIDDPIFIYPLISAYKRFGNSNYSHYFISDLTSFSDPIAYEAMKPLIPTFNEADVSLSLRFLTERNYSDATGLNHIRQAFEIAAAREEISDYELEDYLDFLRQAGLLPTTSPVLVRIFKDQNYNANTRQTAVRYLLILDKKKISTDLLQRYDIVRDCKAELILTKAILNDESPEVAPLKEHLRVHGSLAAKEILEKAKKEEQRAVQTREAQNAVKFSNAPLLSEIVAARSKIDILGQSDSRFSMALFKPFEKLYQQFESAIDRKQLISNAIDIRACVQAINPAVSNHGLSLEEAKFIIPGLNNFSGTLNNLHLLLHTKGIAVDQTMFGFKLLNQALSKLAHPEQGSEDERLSALKTINLQTEYLAENWPKLNQGLLAFYRDALRKLIVAIGIGREGASSDAHST